VKLGVTDIYLRSQNKIEDFHDFLNKNNLTAEQILYMGDDIPDFHVMNKVGLPTCPANAVEEIKEISRYISDKNGGEGCVRDVIEQVLKLQGKWLNEDAYNW
ncbi:MAG: KdsC family phosphatase, partial [Bacteroidota bacterium]